VVTVNKKLSWKLISIVTLKLSDTMERSVDIACGYEIGGFIAGNTKPAAEHYPVAVHLTII
jgi:hypothetical protein